MVEGQSKILRTCFAVENFPVEWASEEEKTLHWWFDNAHTPHPLTPLFASLWKQVCEEGANYAITRLSLPSASEVRLRTFNGYMYIAVVPRRVSAEEKRRLEAEHNKILPVYLRDMPQRWTTLYEPELKNNLAYLDPDECEGADVHRLLVLFEDALDMQTRHWNIHWILNFTQFIGFLIFEQTYDELIGMKDEKEATALLNTTDNKNFEVIRKMWELSKEIRTSETLTACFTKPPEEVLKALTTTTEGNKFLNDLHTFLRENGNKATYNFEYIHPTWLEDPRPVIETIRTYLETDYDFDQHMRDMIAKRKEATERALKKTNKEEDRRKFKEILDVAQMLAPLTPNHHFYIDQWTFAAVRRIALLLGKRLVALGILDHADDVFFFDEKEIKRMVLDPTKLGYKHIAADRRRLRDEQFKLTPPRNLGTITEESATEPVKVKLWGWRLEEEETEPQILKGLAASPGVIEGPARVISGPDEFGEVKAGDILVCEMTTPVWSPLFSKISGIVTNSGGMLAHPAILAREFHIPGVVCTTIGTRIIKNGQKIRVDGNTGAVTILST